MIARYAHAYDLPRVIKMSEAAHAESPRYLRAPFNRAKVDALAESYLAGGPLIVLVADRRQPDMETQLAGYLFGLVTPHYFSDALTASSVSLYVSPEHRGSSAAYRLLQHFEQIARVRGATEVVLGGSSGLFISETTRLYHKLGYTDLGPMTVKYLE